MPYICIFDHYKILLKSSSQDLSSHLEKVTSHSFCIPPHTSFIQLSYSSKLEETRGKNRLEAATKVTIADGSSPTVVVHNIFCQI